MALGFHSPTRPPAVGTRGMVASPHQLASAAGLHVLQMGGSAVDAAIALNSTLGVVYPHMTGLGATHFGSSTMPQLVRYKDSTDRDERRPRPPLTTTAIATTPNYPAVAPWRQLRCQVPSMPGVRPMIGMVACPSAPFFSPPSTTLSRAIPSRLPRRCAPSVTATSSAKIPLLNAAFCPKTRYLGRAHY